MSDVNLVATKDFSYATRRLKAGDEFTVPERMARVLVGIKKAEPARVVGRVAAPSQRLLNRALTSTPAKEEEAPKRTRRRRRTAKKG